MKENGRERGRKEKEKQGEKEERGEKRKEKKKNLSWTRILLRLISLGVGPWTDLFTSEVVSSFICGM